MGPHFGDHRGQSRVAEGGEDGGGRVAREGRRAGRAAEGRGLCVRRRVGSRIRDTGRALRPVTARILISFLCDWKDVVSPLQTGTGGSGK